MEQVPLFALSEHAGAAPAPNAATLRLCFAERQQVQLRYAALDELLAGDHQAWVVWAFVEAQNLSPLLQAIEARTNTPGCPAIDPKILMGLWLLATLDGVGSARELNRRYNPNRPAISRHATLVNGIHRRFLSGGLGWIQSREKRSTGSGPKPNV